MKVSSLLQQPLENALPTKDPQVRRTGNQLSQSHQAHSYSILPSEIADSWQEIPFLTKLTQDDQERFSLYIARELQHALDKKIWTPLHYDKKTVHSLTNNSPFTFYIHVKPEKNRGVVSINGNKTDCKVGKGAQRIIHSGLKIHVPLEQSDQTETTTKLLAIARAHELGNFDQDLWAPNETHKKLLELMKEHQLPGRLTRLPKQREHVQKTTGLIKKEMCQPLYPSDMEKLRVSGCYPSQHGQKYVAFIEKLRVLEELFQTIDSINELGYVHRDLKPLNVFLDEENGILHSYVHDFDFTSESILGTFDNYFYWDELGKIGIVSSSSDLVGLIFTAIDILYGNVNYKDVNHDEYKHGTNNAFDLILTPKILDVLENNDLPLPGNFSAEGIIQFLSDLSLDAEYTHAQQNISRQLKVEVETGLKLMSLFCSYLEKESVWKDQLLNSCLKYYEEIGSHEPQASRFTFEGRFLLGIQRNFKNQIKDKLKSIIDRIGYTTQEYENICPRTLYGHLAFYYSKESNLTTSEEKAQFNEIWTHYQILLNLQKYIPEQMPEGTSSQIFRLLSSNDPQEKAQGREFCYQMFGRASTIAQQLHQIAKEFEAHMKALSEFDRLDCE